MRFLLSRTDRLRRFSLLRSVGAIVGYLSCVTSTEPHIRYSLVFSQIWRLCHHARNYVEFAATELYLAERYCCYHLDSTSSTDRDRRAAARTCHPAGVDALTVRKRSTASSSLRTLKMRYITNI
ncbi:hypothetical protein CRV24_002771 [Beauveria bassiana]|nr:hypothetical protein CRV24_002771 [Beauveria bassiana]